MNKFWVFSIAFLAISCGDNESNVAPVPPFELSESKNTTPTYDEGIAFWQNMADYYDEIRIMKYGITDAGLPLHVVIIDGDRPKPLGSYKRSMKQTLLINNAIHAGESDGVDASMLLANQLMTDARAKKLLENTTVVVIPFYNIGGALNRNTSTRANQNGPEEYGFRGNAQNLDLNRDFMKCDSKNALSFATLINELDPDLYMETHVSNGADYPYTITYISSQEDKIGKAVGANIRNDWTPHITKKVSAAGFQIGPYVNVHGTPPDSGFSTFYDSPRYSTGYLSLRSTPGYVIETHMLKPYQKRVEATYEFLLGGVDLLANFSIRAAVDQQRKITKNSTDFVLDWVIDSSARAIVFSGYEAGYKTSEVTGKQRLFYDRSKPWSTKIPYYERLKPSKQVQAPTFYILKRGYVAVEERLRANGVNLTEYGKDTVLELEVYHIDTFSTVTRPFEKHYYHYDTRITKTTQQIKVSKHDYVIRLDNDYKRFLVESLEPEGPDSYFNWNFFDAILQQKEWYSSYVFEDEAAQLLRDNVELRTKFEAKKEVDISFKSNAQAQLYWIYINSDHYEKSHMRYPVYRGEDNI